MKRLMGMFAVGALAFGVNGCGLEAAVNELSDEIAKAAEQVKVEAVFSKAITSVTFASLDAALTAVTAEVAAAPALGLLAEPKTTNIDSSTTDKDGTVFAVKGTVTVTDEETTASVAVDLTSTWTGSITLDDGTKSTISGESKVVGSVSLQRLADGDVVTLEFKNTGSIVVDGKSYPFDVTVTWSSATNQVLVAGKVNGKEIIPVSTTVDLDGEVEDEVDPDDLRSVNLSCVSNDGEVCHEYTGAGVDAESSICLEMDDADQDRTYTTATTACDTENFSGGCLLNEGGDYEETKYSVDLNQAACEEMSGTWIVIE